MSGTLRPVEAFESLESELVTTPPSRIEAALESLTQAGLVRVEDGKALATEAAKYLEALGLIAL